jgi:hypothetical protein
VAAEDVIPPIDVLAPNTESIELPLSASKVRSFLRPEVELKDLTSWADPSNETLIVYISVCFALTLLGGLVFVSIYLGLCRNNNNGRCCGSVRKRKLVTASGAAVSLLPTTVHHNR